MYVLTQSWQPEFCHGHSYPGCSHPNASEYMYTHLTLHGLWPQYAMPRHGQTYPFNCSSEKFDPTVLSRIPGGVDAIEEYWPNVKSSPGNWAAYTGFCQHEWQKHGTCTGLSQVQYFSTAVSYLKKQGTPSLISSHISSSVTKAALQAAYGGASRVSLGCGGGKYLSQVMTCWGLDKKSHLPTSQVDCPQAVLSEDSCSSTVFISGFGDGPSPPSPPAPGNSTCVSGVHGPRCSSDSQCTAYKHCIRCAHSGFCTNVPK